MIKEFVNQWDKNKKELEEYFRTHKQEEYNEYLKIVKLLIQYVLNKGLNDDWDEIKINPDTLTEIDFGDYQGTLIYVFAEDTYQPSTNETFYTSVAYGSCSGCDTLQAIQGCDLEELPNEEQVEDYMKLSLDILQSINRFKDYE